jgi:hypothetical protein
MPQWVPILLACERCGERWDDWQPSNVPVATWVAHCGTFHCPMCGKGGRHVLLRSQFLDSASR